MQIKNKKYVMGFVAMLGAVVCMTGCTQEKMQIVIRDGQVETRLEANVGETVESLLQEAEIAVSDKDEIVPGLQERVTQTGSEIVVSRCAKVTLVDDSDVVELEMTGKLVKDVLEQNNITLGEHDYMNHSANAYLADGMNIEIIRRNEVTLVVDGDVRKCITTAKDVQGLLDEQMILLDAKDRVSPARTMELSEGIEIKVERVSVVEVVEQEPIEFTTVTEYSSAMYTDEVVEKTPGVQGVKEVTYSVTYVDGKEAARRVVSEKVVTEPVARVVTKGTKQKRYIVSKQAVADCDGSGHGYYIITWSDGTVEYVDY